MGNFSYRDALGQPKESEVVTDPRISAVSLSAAQSNETATPTEVVALSLTLQPGTYVFQYFIIYQSTATTTGVRFSVDYTGTTTKFVANWHVCDNTATASTAAADQDAVAAGGQVYCAFAARAKSSAGWGTTISVDTQNADMFAKVEGIMVVTTEGDIRLYHGSEDAVSTSVRPGTSLVLMKVS